MGARKSYKPWNPTQSYLLPPSPTDWLAEGHLAYFILDVVGELDLRVFDAAIQEKDPRGQQPYAPEMMVAVLLYGYSVGVFSSRKLERATYEDVAFRVLAAGEHPHFTTISQFRRTHLESLKSLFLNVLRLCQEAGLVKFGHVALDGTKIQGNASKHKAMSYERMLKTELQLKGEVEELIARAKAADLQEDAHFGEGERDEDLPAELRRREDRLRTIAKAKERLENEAAEARARALRIQATRAEERATTTEDPVEKMRATTMAKNRRAKAEKLVPGAASDDLDPPRTSDGLPMHEPPAATDGTPKPTAQMNFTDPDSRIMESAGGFVQGYNCQAAVDDANQIIVAEAVSNLSPDNGNMVPMFEVAVVNCGEPPVTATADAGYWTPLAPAACEAMGIDPYISTRRREVKGASASVSTAQTSSTTPERDAMTLKLGTPNGRRVYARRKATVEPVFGQIKEVRGFRRFSLRGLEAVQAEWALICATHNLLKLWRARIAAAAPAATILAVP